MDEVFDLKSKDQWFRKRIVILLRQIINATYGDAINRYKTFTILMPLPYFHILTKSTQFL